MTTPAPLPGRDQVGTAGTWKITDQYGDSVTIGGELLGLGSSWRPRHQERGQLVHPDSEFAPPKVRCSTCRWTEIRIFGADLEKTNALAEYLVVKRGVSIIPGEEDLVEWDWLVSADEVMEKLTTRRDGNIFLTAPASRAASQAAEFDTGLRDAWRNRAVK